ncbi:MAG: FAD-binding oxidoreductase [Anaerolineae bacterium]|jgi:D-lactate dehydrogenase (cytochrome)|nr:FAD-binding oxidoreductase [Anaerolineae bacterium]
MTQRFAAVSPALLADLTASVGADNLSTTGADLALHAQDAGFHPAHAAEVVVWARSAEQVARVLRLASQAGVPVTPWGVGTGLEGNAIPLYGGILLSLERMDAIVAVHADDFQVTVQPGICHKDLNEKLARYGLFFPPDPGANATIGGMLANNAAGIRTVKYGASKDNVLRMQVALPDGRLIYTGSRSVKQSAGYNLTQLFVGSEGTLGIITEATLKLVPVPQFMSAMIAGFATVEAAIETVVAVRGSGVDVAALEFLDETNTRALNAAGTDIAPYPTLLLEIHAAHAGTLEQDIAIVRDLCQQAGALSFRATADTAERKVLWNARHHAYETLVRNHPGQKIFIMDVSVPISAYPDLIAFSRQVLAEHGISGYMKGHAGDGNIHVELPFGDPDTYARVQAVNSAIVLKAIALGGTCTGEHGVGIGKAAYMAAEHGAALAVMQQIKALLDPQGILNPGKIFPQA